MENLTRENAVEDKFRAGDLDQCIEYLIKCRQEGKSVWVEFNDHKLYSCDATVNNIYMQVLGKTKEEYEKDEQEFLAGLRAEKAQKREEMLKSIPEWLNAGQKLVYPEKAKEWERMVGIRANDLYGGTDLGYAITAMEMLDGGATYENVASYVRGLATSGNSMSMVESIILNFSKSGPQFYEYIKGGPENIDENTRGMIDKIRTQNKEYEINEILSTKGPEWVKRAEKLIYPERMSEWERIIKQRAGEKFKGSELDMALGAMELLDKGVSFDKVEKYIEDKSTSATGATMAENIVLNFSKSGPEFFESIRPEDARELVAQLKDINAKLAERHSQDQEHETDVEDKKIDPRDELASLAAEKRSLEEELKGIEAELSAQKKQEDKTKGQGIGEE